MKNLKVSREQSSKLQLQSLTELIRCSAFDIEQNRFFFASSPNFIYTIHLSFSSQNEESWGKRSPTPLFEAVDLDDGDSITSLQYLMEKDSLSVGTSSSVLLLYNVDDSVMEVVGGVEGGVKSISPSPDGDLLCIITGIGQMLVMTHDWDLLFETALDDPVEDADVRDGSFHSECSTGNPATWRDDGKFFATVEAFKRILPVEVLLSEREESLLSEPKDDHFASSSRGTVISSNLKKRRSGNATHTTTRSVNGSRQSHHTGRSSDWMRIGAFCIDSSDAFPMENLIRPTKFPKEKKVQNMLNFCGSCVLQNIKTGIWIAGNL